MDEELEQPNKISPESFFEQLTAVRETADAAQKTSNSNLSLLNSLKTEIQVLSTEFKLFKDEKADEDFAEQDRKQKELMDQRAKAQGEKKGEGTSAEKESDEQKGGGGIGGFIKNFFGGLIGGTLGIALQGVAGLVDFGAKSVVKAKEIGGGIADALTFNMFDFDGKGKPDKKNLSSIMGGDKDYEKNRKKNIDLKDEVKKELKDDLGTSEKELKEEIKGELKEEFNLGDSIKETGKNILGGIKKTFGGIKDTISNFDGRPGSRKTKDTKKEVIKKEESFSIPEGKKTSFGDALSGNRDTIHQFLFEERIKSVPTGEAFNDFSGNPAYDSDVDTFLRGLKDSPQGYGIEINSGRVYLSKEKAVDGGYTFGRDTKYEGVKSDNEKYGDTFPKGSFSAPKKNTYERAMLEFDEGGFVSGPGGEDKVNAKLTSGEFVMSKGATQKIGVSNLMAMNEDGGGTNEPTLSIGGNDLDMSIFEEKQTSVGGVDSAFMIDGEKQYLTPSQIKKQLTKMNVPYKELLNGMVIPDAAKMAADKMPEYYDKTRKIISETVKDEKMREKMLNELEKFMTNLAGGGDFKDTSQIEAEMNRYIPGTLENLGLQIGDSAKKDYLAQKFSGGGLVTNKNISAKLESDDFEINAITNLSQSVDNIMQDVKALSAESQITNPPNQNPSPLAPAQPPQVSETELKSTFAPIPAINILKMNSEKYLSISGDSVMVAS